MCLISIAPIGTEKYSKEFLDAVRRGANSNRDGHGFACKYYNSGIVFYIKGYDNIEELITKLKELELTKDDELIVHSRTGNRGDKTADYNCHPYVLSEKQSEIIDLTGVTDKPVMFHNGTFFKYSEDKSIYSDTYHFIKQFMCIPEFIDLLKRDPKLFAEIFNEKITYNKLAFLFPDRNLVSIGDFTEDKGYFFSNQGYKDSSHYDVGGRSLTDYRRNIGTRDFSNPINSGEITELNSYGIPLNQYTIKDVYFQRLNPTTNRPEYFVFDEDDYFDPTADWWWFYKVSLDLVDDKKKFDNATSKVGHMFYRRHLTHGLTVLPKDKNLEKYSHYLLLVYEKFNENQKKMKKLSNCFLNSKENKKVHVKGIKHPINRQAIILYLKVYEGLLEGLHDKENKEEKVVEPTFEQLILGN